MTSFDPAKYGDSAALFYDQLYNSVDIATVTALTQLAGSGPVLDLGIGTGRMAIPLVRANVDVHGIEASAAMIAKLRQHTELKNIPIIQGDFSSTPLANQYQLVYSLVSTFLLLPSLENQQACFYNIARHLNKGGCFVSEIYESENNFPTVDETVIPVITGEGVKDYHVTYLGTPIKVLDEMAAKAGLRLKERWSDWKQSAYTVESVRHISVYQLESKM
jgi:SAM-dependent methyltransferase